MIRWVFKCVSPVDSVEVLAIFHWNHETVIKNPCQFSYSLLKIVSVRPEVSENAVPAVPPAPSASIGPRSQAASAPRDQPQRHTQKQFVLDGDVTTEQKQWTVKLSHHMNKKLHLFLFTYDYGTVRHCTAL